MQHRSPGSTRTGRKLAAAGLVASLAGAGVGAAWPSDAAQPAASSAPSTARVVADNTGQGDQGSVTAGRTPSPRPRDAAGAARNGRRDSTPAAKSAKDAGQAAGATGARTKPVAAPDLLAAPTREAFPVPAGWQLRWQPRFATEGLKAFEGVEDDRDHSDPGVTHIRAVQDVVRFDMPVKEREGSDRQRNEVKGMRTNGENLEIDKGETWRLTYSMFIPDSLRATSSFTHIMQMKMPGPGSAPLMTISLRRHGSTPTIELKADSLRTLVGSTSLTPLQNKWIDVSVEITAGDKPDGKIAWTIKDGSRTVLSVQKSGLDTFLDDRLRPKWGIYRSLSDKANLRDTFLLIANMRAYQRT